MLDTIEKAVRSVLDIYKKDLQDVMDYPPQEFKFHARARYGICMVIDSLLDAPDELKGELELKVTKRVCYKLAYLCIPPVYCETTDDLIYAYQARISLLEEILIEATPVDKEEVLGTFEKFNNILY